MSRKLYDAAIVGDENKVRELLPDCLDVNEPDDYGETPLHYAADSGHVSIIELLLRYGAEIDGRNRHRQTPLMRAAMFGHLEAVRFLLDKDADPKLTGEDGVCLLEYAKTGENEQVICLLRDAMK